MLRIIVFNAFNFFSEGSLDICFESSFHSGWGQQSVDLYKKVGNLFGVRLPECSNGPFGVVTYHSWSFPISLQRMMLAIETHRQ